MAGEVSIAFATPGSTNAGNTRASSKPRLTAASSMMFALTVLGTSSIAQVASAGATPQPLAIYQTTNGGSQDSPISPQSKTRVQKLKDLRRRSGLSWMQIAQLFGVSRRSVHLWASGQRMTDHHAQLLDRQLQVIIEHDQGDPYETKRLLLSAQGASRSQFQLMVDHAMRSSGQSLRPDDNLARLLETDTTVHQATETVRGGRRLNRSSSRGTGGTAGTV